MFISIGIFIDILDVDYVPGEPGEPTISLL